MVPSISGIAASSDTIDVAARSALITPARDRRREDRPQGGRDALGHHSLRAEIVGRRGLAPLLPHAARSAEYGRHTWQSHGGGYRPARAGSQSHDHGAPPRSGDVGLGRLRHSERGRGNGRAAGAPHRLRPQHAYGDRHGGRGDPSRLHDIDHGLSPRRRHRDGNGGRRREANARQLDHAARRRRHHAEDIGGERHGGASGEDTRA